MKESQKQPENKKSGIEQVREVNSEKKVKKPIFKKPLFWLAITLSIIGIGLAIFAAIFLSSQSANKKAISDGWFAIVEKNKTLSQLAEKVENQQAFDAYSSELKKLNILVDEKKYSAQKLKYKQADAKRYDNFLNDYQSYINDSIKNADNIKEFSESARDNLKSKSEQAKNSASELKSNTKYLKEDLPASTFLVQDVLFEANKVILTSELSAKARLLAEEQATAKDASDKKAVENTAGNFLNAFLAGNAPLMRQYMTEAYQKEYDFNQLTPEARATTYPASFRIISNQKVETAKYKVQANVIFKFRDGSSQYIVGYELNVIYDSPQSKWLVNSSREGSSF
jgi:hypothetical protein